MRVSGRFFVSAFEQQRSDADDSDMMYLYIYIYTYTYFIIFSFLCLYIFIFICKHTHVVLKQSLFGVVFCYLNFGICVFSCTVTLKPWPWNISEVWKSVQIFVGRSTFHFLPIFVQGQLSCWRIMWVSDQNSMGVGDL